MLKPLNGIRLVRFEPEAHTAILYNWYYAGDYPEFYRNLPDCPSMQQMAANKVDIFSFIYDSTLSLYWGSVVGFKGAIS